MPKRFIFSFWLLAMALNAVTIWLSILVKDCLGSGTLHISLVPDIDFIIFDLLFTFIFSLPGIFALMLLIWIAKEFMYTVHAAFQLLFIGCSLVSVFCYVVMELVLEPGMSIAEYLPFVSATLIAVWISLFATRKLFYSFIVNTYRHELV